MTEATVVIGGGTMGAGIVEVLLDAGAAVTLVEPMAAVQQKVADELGDRDGLTIVDAFDAAIDPVFVVEAVPEDIALKQRVLAGIEAAVGVECLVATNTSSLSIDALAEPLGHPERFIGMHFFNPVPRSALVEIVVGEATDPDTIARAAAWVDRLGKEHIEVKDSPGFATSRLGLAIGLEAIRMLEEGVASADDIDRGMILGYRFPMGPLKLTDMVGLDVRLAIAEHLARELGPRFEPPELLRRKVADGELGRKTGQGFYSWDR
jgi:3-hydroxybutyryl-CoA dehydrogenase